MHANLLCEVAKYLPKSQIYNLLKCTRSSIDIETIYMLKIKQQFPGYLEAQKSGESGSSISSGESGSPLSEIKEQKPQFLNLYERLKYVTSDIKIIYNLQHSQNLGYLIVGNTKFKLSVMIRQLFMRIYGLGDLSIFKYFLQKYPYRNARYYAHVIYDLSTYTDKSWHIFEYIRNTNIDMFTSLFGFRDRGTAANFNWIYIQFSLNGGPISKIFEIDANSLINFDDFLIGKDNGSFRIKNILNVKSAFESNRSTAIKDGFIYIPEESGIQFMFKEPTVQIYLGPGEEANEEHKKWLIDVYNSINISSDASSIKTEIIEDYPHSSPDGF